MEKYKELYDLAVAVLNEEINRFTRLDQKASIYLSVFSILLAIFVGMSKWLIDAYLPIENFLDGLIVILFFVSAVIFLWGWIFSFRVLKNHDLVKIPMNDEMIRFFDENDLVDVYFAMSKGIKNAKHKNTLINDKKSISLGRSHTSILAALLSLVVLFLLIFASIVMEKSKKTTAEEVLWQSKKIRVLIKKESK